jgi:hypothetical protein
MGHADSAGELGPVHVLLDHVEVDALADGFEVMRHLL